jgi:LysM repeat protein
MPASFSHSAPTIVTLTPLAQDNNAKYYPVSMGLIDNADYGLVGQGGWQVVDRPKMNAATQWFDRSPYQLKFSAILDKQLTSSNLGNYVPISIEDDCSQLESWMDKVDNAYEPPILAISGPVPGIQRVYVVYAMSFTEAVRDSAAGFRTQQKIDITLYEYSPPLGGSLVSYSSSPTQQFVEQQNASEKAGTQQFLLYTIKEGDTLIAISNYYYAGANYVAKIKTLNNIRDDSSIGVMAGQVIKLPRL